MLWDDAVVRDCDFILAVGCGEQDVSSPPLMDTAHVSSTRRQLLAYGRHTGDVGADPLCDFSVGHISRLW